MEHPRETISASTSTPVLTSPLQGHRMGAATGHICSQTAVKSPNVDPTVTVGAGGNHC